MSNDMLLARDENNSLNLAIGEPSFLELYMKDFCPSTLPSFSNKYPNSNGMLKLRQKFARYLKDSIGLESDPNNIVVTNGAKQALIASAIVEGEDMGAKYLYHPSPYWLSYPTIAKYADLEFTDGVTQDVKEKGCVAIYTSPNNPDGKLFAGGCDIWDAVYANRVYGYDPKVSLKHWISVFSAAKMFGMSGLRVGFAVCRDFNRAAKVAAIIEKTTSGVSNIAQEYLCSVLDNIDARPDQYAQALNGATNYLQSNTRHISIIEEHIEKAWGSFEYMGMFGMIKVKDPERFKQALVKSNVKFIPGNACGMLEQGTYRINMGATADVIYNAFTALAKELNR